MKHRLGLELDKTTFHLVALDSRASHPHLEEVFSPATACLDGESTQLIEGIEACSGRTPVRPNWRG